MEREAASLQRGCQQCQQYLKVEESAFVQQVEDWRLPYKQYLENGTLPSNVKDAINIKRRAVRFFLQGGELFRRALDGLPLKCVAPGSIELLLREAHQFEHQGKARLFQHLLNKGYYWPTMEEDAANWVKRCNQCQKFADRVNAPSVPLHQIKAPWPFHTWTMDLIGPISQPSRGKKWILVATETTSKWVEAAALGSATGEAVARFIKENIICMFGIPRVILSDNGTPFVNSQVGDLLDQYGIRHRKSTPYYPQGNGQAEASNKTVVRILSKLLDQAGGHWYDKLPIALWAYRTSKKASTQASPFALVYGSEAVLPMEIAVESARMAKAVGWLVGDRRSDLEACEERRDRAAKCLEQHQKRVARFYDKSVIQ